MSPGEIRSKAFRQAQLRSERLRILGVIGFVFAFTVLIAIRILIFKSPVSIWALVAPVVLIAYELFLLGAVRRAEKAGKDLPFRVWVASILIETSFPAIGVAFLTTARLPQVYRPLASPWKPTWPPVEGSTGRSH